jgi:hypothetical protein
MRWEGETGGWVSSRTVWTWQQTYELYLHWEKKPWGIQYVAGHFRLCS